jgi:hypothetical protein
LGTVNARLYCTIFQAFSRFTSTPLPRSSPYFSLSSSSSNQATLPSAENVTLRPRATYFQPLPAAKWGWA